MDNGNFKISEFEKIVRTSSRYISRTDETLGQPEHAREKINLVTQFLKERRLSPDILSVFGDSKSPGLVYVELPQGTREFHGQAAQMLLECCLYDAEGQTNERAWDRWRDFGRNIYYGTVEEIYHNFASAKPELALIFELAYRQLMYDASQSWWEQQPEAVKAKEQLVMQRFNLELTALLRPLRDKLFQKHSIETDLFEKLLDHGWNVEFDTERPQARNFAPLLRELHLSEWMITEIFHLLYTDQLKSSEEALWEKLGSSNFTKPDDITTLLSGSLAQVSEIAAKEIQKVLIKKVSELEIKLNQELSDLQKYTSRVKKQTQDMVMLNNSDMSKVVDAKLYSENLLNLSAKVTDSLMQFQRNLTGQLWYLQDLERKEKTLQASVERCQSLQRMSLKDLTSLLTAQSSEIHTDILRHLEYFNNLGQAIKYDWEGLANRLAKILVEMIRQGLEQSHNKVKALDREAARRNPNDPHVTAALYEMEQAQADGRAISGLIEEQGGNRAFHVELLIDNYKKFLKDVAEPIINYRRLASLVRLWPPMMLKAPPVLRQQELCDEVFYLSERLKRYDRCFSFVAQGAVLPKAADTVKNDIEIREKIYQRFSRVVSVMVYDIRGSSFMSSKLLNAEKEREIKNKLGYMIAQVIRQHGGFIVKDTGDGGLAWFGDNAHDVYEKCYKEVFTGKGLKLRHSISSGTDLNILPSTESTKQAVDCACEMLRVAEKFIQENFSNYRDWFRDAKEREILYEGINYAVLPPAFKALFRIGVGIASGASGKEINLSLNSFGDTDLCGTAVNNASLYATGKDPTRSVILLDHLSFGNLMFNIERFTSLCQEQLWTTRTTEVDEWENKLRESLKLCDSSGDEGSYFIPGKNYSIKRTGYQIVGLSNTSKETSLRMETSDREISMQDDGRFMDHQTKAETKFLYEIQPQDKGNL
jgi:hypothetical protein